MNPEAQNHRYGAAFSVHGFGCRFAQEELGEFLDSELRYRE